MWSLPALLGDNDSILRFILKVPSSGDTEWEGWRPTRVGGAAEMGSVH